MEDFFESEQHIRIEKAKARELRNSRWWQQKLQTSTCYYCKSKLEPALATMDHLVPLSRGGSTTKSNVVPCCKDCNNKKKNLLPMEWDFFAKNGDV